MKKLLSVIVCGTVLILTSASTLAEEEEVVRSPPFGGLETGAWLELDKIITGYLNEDVAARLRYIAYHKVAEQLCPDVSTDSLKINAAMLELEPENISELTDAEVDHWSGVVLLHMGMMIGVLLAEHTDVREPVCIDAHELIADETASHYFDTEIETDTEPEA